jgi:hypothetical protein
MLIITPIYLNYLVSILKKIEFLNQFKEYRILLIQNPTMDLKQRKLNRSEWESIEVPVSKSEIDVLKLIIDGYHNVNIRVNTNKSIFTFLKIDYTTKMEEYLYNKYLRERVNKIEAQIILINPTYKKIEVDGIIKLNSIDRVRLERNDESAIKKENIYEFTLLAHIEKILQYKNNNEKLFTFHYFTICKLIKNNIHLLNSHIIHFTNKVIEIFADEIELSVIIENGVDFIEKNESLLKYSDMVLYEHQKEIFTVCKNSNSKLVLYMAPTGTGKTMSPIALSEKHNIIFVCAARHVGLALAKASISVGKKIAFAFGCASADDIRLHYFAAKEYTTNKRTGGIKKVDNSAGENVEIIICDIKSYLPAMYYMLAFNKKENIITYWDEPTITLDYKDHDFHKIIRQNWKKNIIPNMVLSSATLPKLNELAETIPDFKNKFPGSEIYNIVSHDCKKSIPILNKDGYVVLPHYLSDNYEEIRKIASHCDNYLTLLRYFDLKEVVEFISYVNKKNMSNNKMILGRHFESFNDINMKTIKVYYVKLLQNIEPTHWNTIYSHFIKTRTPRIVTNETVDPKGCKIIKSRSVGPGLNVFGLDKTTELSGTPLTRLASEQVLSSSNTNQKPVGTSGAYITTKDSYTLTDGPTIFISDEVEKIAKFCIQQANIPSLVMDEIMKKIDFNNVLNTKLALLETDLEQTKERAENSVKNEVNVKNQGSIVSGRNKSSKDIKKFNRESSGDDIANKSNISKLAAEITSLRSMIKSATLNDTFVPNKSRHIKKWCDGLDTTGAFTSDIDERIISEIMSLNGINDSWKVLLMMGIGVFINHDNIRYTEIMKNLADEQKLYLIIASSDYIYGTNYQFCHGYLSKDLNLTQEKIIQAMGRIGRNNIQQTYTLRFRDDQQILKLFTSETEKPEIINMNRLFNSRKVIWENSQYIEIEDDIEDDIEDEVCKEEYIADYDVEEY